MIDLEGVTKELTGTPVEFPQTGYHSVDGVYIRKIFLPKDTFAPQHAHAHSHSTIVVGHIRAWKDKKAFGEFRTGDIIEIEANALHTFYALEDSVIFCVHNEEHALVVAEGKV